MSARLFELEDQPWFPQLLRRQQVEFIGWLVERFGVYAPVAEGLRAALQRLEATEVTDLGSGQGGPVRYLSRLPGLAHVRFLLSDLYPAPSEVPEGTVRWHPVPVDALGAEVPGNGPVTLFNAFHHFGPEEQASLVRMHGRRGLFIYEVLQPTLPAFLKILFTTTVGQLLLAPFVRPFRWERLFLTYLLPINLFTIPWDGLVSVARSEAPESLVERLRAAAPPGVSVQGGGTGPWWAPVTWIHCQPLTAV